MASLEPKPHKKQYGIQSQPSYKHISHPDLQKQEAVGLL